MPNGGRQVIGTMLLWDATNLPEGFLDPLSQGLEAFAEANAGSFGVGGSQHKVIDHVRKGFSCNGHAQILHMGEIGLGSLSGLVSLFKDDLLLRPRHSTPSGNVPLQGPDLGRSIATWVLLTEQRKQGGPLQRWIAFELCDHPGPVLLKRIVAGSPGMRTLELRRKLARLFIFAGGALAHPCACSR